MSESHVVDEIYGLSPAQIEANQGPTEQHHDHETEETPDHLALIYEDLDEQFSAVVPFIRQGLERGEQCLYIVDDNTKPEVLGELRASEIDVESAIEDGDLVVLTPADTYLKTGLFDSDSMLEFWRDSLDDARAEYGYTGLRAAAEMTWAIEAGTEFDDLTTYESIINDLYAGEDYVVLCQYNRKRFPAAVLSDVLHTHPLVVYDETVSCNNYYTAPDKYRQSDQPVLDLDWAMSELFGSKTSEGTTARHPGDGGRGKRRVLPLITDAGNRRVIVDSLTEKYEVVTADEATEALRGGAFDLCILDPESFNRHRRDLIEYKESQKPRILPYLLLRRAGSPVVDGDASQYIDDVIVMPTTGQELEQRLESMLWLRQLSHELEEKNQKLEQKNDQLQYLVDAVAHDLRNPLNIAQGYAKQLDDTQPVTRVRRALDRMEHLVENLLTVNQSEQDITEERLETVAFSALVAECWEMVPTKNAEIEIVADEETRLQAAPSLVQQLVENLIRNAIQHGDDSMTIRVGTLPAADGFYVEDDGPGIPEEERARVFDDGYSTNEGIGLGLSIVKRVADAHGWEIRVTDSEEGGARFEFIDVEVT